MRLRSSRSPWLASVISLLPLLSALTACEGSSQATASGKAAADPATSEAAVAASGAPADGSANNVWVARPDGAQSCSTQGGQSVEDGARELKEMKIPVLKSEKGSDGKMHAQMCGISKGTVNSYLIPKTELGKAKALGYRERDAK